MFVKYYSKSRATKTFTFQSSHTPWQPLLRALNSWQLPLLMKFFCFMFVQMHNRVFPTGGHTVTPGHVVGKAKTQHLTELLPPRSPFLWTVPLQSWGEPDTRHPLHPLRHRACWFHLQISPICHISSTLLHLAKFTLSPCSGTCQTLAPMICGSPYSGGNVFQMYASSRSSALVWNLTASSICSQDRV